MPNTDETQYIAEQIHTRLSEASGPLAADATEADKDRRKAEISLASNVVESVIKDGDDASDEMRRNLANYIDPVGAHERETLRHQRNEARRQAETDAITGLGNRTAFERARIDADADPDTFVGVIDVDKFKAANSKLEHSGGDALLLKVSETINGCGLHRLFRIGGDEFALIGSKEEVSEALKKIETDFETALEAGEIWPDTTSRMYFSDEFRGLGLGLKGFMGETFAEADGLLTAYKNDRDEREAAEAASAE